MRMHIPERGTKGVTDVDDLVEDFVESLAPINAEAEGYIREKENGSKDGTN